MRSDLNMSKLEEGDRKITLSPTKRVRFVNQDGFVTKIIPMNRRERRRAGIR